MKDQISQHLRAAESAARNTGLFEDIAKRIIDCFDSGGRLFLIGNGGSAADAQHVAAELIGRFKQSRRALPAIALTTDTSGLTAVANDLGFEQVFERQIEALVTAGDMVWALSVSGTSPNIVRGLQAARKKGAMLIGFTGNSANNFERLCDFCFRVDHASSDRVQEIHQLAYHLVCSAVESHYARPG